MKLAALLALAAAGVARGFGNYKITEGEEGGQKYVGVLTVAADGTGRRLQFGPEVGGVCSDLNWVQAIKCAAEECAAEEPNKKFDACLDDIGIEEDGLNAAAIDVDEECLDGAVQVRFTINTGSFQLSERAARAKGRNPQTGKEVKIAARRKLIEPVKTKPKRIDKSSPLLACMGDPGTWGAVLRGADVRAVAVSPFDGGVAPMAPYGDGFSAAKVELCGLGDVAVGGVAGALRFAGEIGGLEDGKQYQVCLIEGDGVDDDCDGVEDVCGVERCDGIDNDCDGRRLSGKGGGDCNDKNDNRLPGQCKLCEGIVGGGETSRIFTGLTQNDGRKLAILDFQKPDKVIMCSGTTGTYSTGGTVKVEGSRDVTTDSKKGVFGPCGSCGNGHAVVVAQKGGDDEGKILACACTHL